MATIRKLQSGRWQAQIRISGSPPLSRTFRTKADANRWAKATETSIETGDIQASRRSLCRITLAGLLERYVQEVTPRKRGHRRERSTIRLVMNDPIGDVTLDRLAESHAAQFRDKRAQTRMPATVVRELAVLGNVIEVARREWGVPMTHNPFYRVKKPRIQNARDRRIMAGEWETLKECIAGGSSKDLWPIICFAVETALRLSEICNAKFDDVKSENTLYVPVTKNGHPRTIPLTLQARNIITKRRESGSNNAGYIFDMRYESIRAAWRRAVTLANIIDLRFHDLRHEAVSRFFELGLTVPEVSLISGHRDYRMLARYTHLRPEEVAAKLATATHR